MGCVTSNTTEPIYKSNIQSTQVAPLDSKNINECIDSLPLFIIINLKNRFDKICGTGFEIEESQFIKLYLQYWANIDGESNVEQETGISKEPNNLVHLMAERLYVYFTDNKSTKLTFKTFIAKYSIVNIINKEKFRQIIYFLLSTKSNAKSLEAITKETFNSFILIFKRSFGFPPTQTAESIINLELFEEYLKEFGFHEDDYRKRFSLMDKNDIPFEAISKGLMDQSLDDYEVGKEYYLLSSSWFERWGYYYQGIKIEEVNDGYKSTKLNKRIKRVSNRRKSSDVNRNDVSIDDNTWIIERPVTISHEDIEGEYRGELKDNLKQEMEIKAVTKKIWDLFTKTMKAESVFKRIANSMTNLDLYPKFVYFLETNEEGKINDDSWRIVQMSNKQKLNEVNEQKRGTGKYYYYVKKFEDVMWNEEDEKTSLGMCLADKRFFVVETKNKKGFYENNYRRKITIENLTYGDKVYSFFTFNKKIMPAFIIRLPNSKKSLIHYENFSYRYEVETDNSSLSIDESSLADAIKDSGQKFNQNDEFSFKGLSNCGNTCFINSVIQCLIASPILEKYLVDKSFKEDKQPLLYEISEVSKCLLSNKKVSPIRLKKMIDMELEIFSGNDQHDVEEFLNLLLEKLNNEIKKINKEEETVIEYLFKGKLQAKVECPECQNVNKNEEEFTTISLPIPEPENNTYEILVFPIYESRIRKIVMRLHNRATMRDYIEEIQHRLQARAEEYIFVEANHGILRKVRHDFFHPENSTVSLINLGITSNVEIHCFEKFKKAEFFTILEENKANFSKSNYFDFEDADANCWLYGKKLQNSKIELMNQDNTFSIRRIKQNIESSFRPIGSKTKELTYRKLMQRKFNDALNKMDYFGINYMIAFPKETSFKQLQRLVDLVMKNFVSQGRRSKKNIPYYIKLCEINRQKCLFCERTDLDLSKSEYYKQCCPNLSDEETETPLIWISREKNYNILVDWTNLSERSSEFEIPEIDNLSIQAQKLRESEKINIEDCLKLYQKPENVEMKCDKCKHPDQRRAEILKSTPNILVLHLKEFRVSNVSSMIRLVKLNINLKWIEFLDITGYSMEQKGNVYELYAYIRHTGTNEAGHYTCAAKRNHPFENKRIWVNFDDEIATVIGNEQKNIDSAYLLFFRRVDMPNSAYINFTHF